MKLLDWIKQWTIVKKEDLDNYMFEISNLNVSVNNLTSQYENVKASLLTKDKTISVLVAQLNAKEPKYSDAEYWNNKWAKDSVYYAAPDRKDVREYVKDKEIPAVDDVVDYIIRTYNLHKDNTEQIALSWMKYKKEKFDSRVWKYVSDPSGKDLWRSPEETIKLCYGDCDDWATLGHYVIRAILKKLGVWKVNKHRLKFVCGNVNRGGTIPSCAGGHAYGVWLGEDNEWYTVESTYYPEMAISNYGKLPQKYSKMYGTIWFSFNEDFAWSDGTLTVSKKDFKK
jgi:hypothetical protein